MIFSLPTRDRLLFPGESGYEGDSGKDWSAMDPKQGSGASPPKTTRESQAGSWKIVWKLEPVSPASFAS